MLNYFEGGTYDGTSTLGTDGVSAGAEAEPQDAESAIPTAALRMDTIFTIFIILSIGWFSD